MLVSLRWRKPLTTSQLGSSSTDTWSRLAQMQDTHFGRRGHGARRLAWFPAGVDSPHPAPVVKEGWVPGTRPIARHCWQPGHDRPTRQVRCGGDPTLSRWGDDWGCKPASASAPAAAVSTPGDSFHERQALQTRHVAQPPQLRTPDLFRGSPATAAPRHPATSIEKSARCSPGSTRNVPCSTPI
jgi:hypothetical protein